MKPLISIDGSMGEGGGQVLRTSLSLSLLTSTPIRIDRIRTARSKPGLMRQHLMSVNAAAEIGDADVSGNEIGSTSIEFHPKQVRGGNYRFAVDGAGSTTLIFQTILWPLLLGTTGSPSTVSFEGGTHNPMAPPFDFVEKAFLPVVGRMGGRVDATLERCGFYPAGGGRWSATIHPVASLMRLELNDRPKVRNATAKAIVAHVPRTVADRELSSLASILQWDVAQCVPDSVSDSAGPGNVLLAFVESDLVTEVFTSLGERGKRSEAVAHDVAVQVKRYLNAEVPVGEHLADQLLLPMALGNGGSFRTVKPSLHTTTQIDLLKKVIGAQIRVTEESSDVFRIDVASPSGGSGE